MFVLSEVPLLEKLWDQARIKSVTAGWREGRVRVGSARMS